MQNLEIHTATAATGHHIDTLIVNGVAFTSGETMIVAGHITISATSIINIRFKC